MIPSISFIAAATWRKRPLRTVLAGAVAIAAACAPWLVDAYTLGSLARMASLGLLAVSVAILTGWAGLPSLGQIAPYAVGAYTAATLARAGIAVGPVQLVLAGAAAAVFSTLTGAALVRTRGLVFLMASLAIGELTATAAARWKSVTGGTDGLAGIPAARPFWSAAPLTDDRAVYAYALTVAAIVVAGVWLWLRSPAGLLLMAVRDSEQRTAACGHRSARHLLCACLVSGAVAGVGGALLITSQRYISPADIAFEVSALTLLAVTLGGATSLAGVLAAAALVAAVQQWAAVAVPGRGPLLLGVLFIAAVYLTPGGVTGSGGRKHASSS